MEEATEEGSLRIFEVTCGYCGARLRVVATPGPGADEVQDCACPECGKRQEVEAAGELQVCLLARRTDGRTDRHEETTF